MRFPARARSHVNLRQTVKFVPDTRWPPPRRKPGHTVYKKPGHIVCKKPGHTVYKKPGHIVCKKEA